MELVVTRRLLQERPSAVVLEDDEIANEVEQPALLEDPFKHDLELGGMGAGQLLARYRPPGLEPFPPGSQGAYACLDSIRDPEERVEREQRWQLGFVGLK